ncbi:MAG: DUF1998 domain-containing protein [Deltaproteobacteria bacterium]
MNRPVRRSQAISPFGIGALVDFPGPVSLVHAGLDAWPFTEGNPDHGEFRIDDERRLSKRLNVEFFVQPPDFRQPERGQDAAQTNLNLKLPFLRFPLWHISVKAARTALRNYYPESAIDPAALAEAANKHILIDVLLGDRKIQAFLSQKIKVSTDKKLSGEMVVAAIRSHCPDWGIDPLAILPALSEKLEGKRGDTDHGANTCQDTLIESDYRREEYRIFCRDMQEGYPKTNLLIRSSDLKNYGELARSSFDRISLLHKLRETRAFVGFSRIFPDELTQEEQWKLITREKKRWLPAVIVRGEGIFLKFREDKLNLWLDKHGAFHNERLSTINANMGKMRERRNQEPKVGTPKYILIHTLAHLLVNQLVYQCGYGSASLRERIYAADGENPMSGVLIYTAPGDSEGTMGGLVRMGQPGYFEEILAKAIEKARWCSSDPVCIESKGQGPDNCNLGACHSCTLLPETSCEEQNRLLDRGVVVGTLEKPDVGYFSV